MIVLKNLSACHGETEKPILNDINITIPPGTCYALIGQSGSGKTTLLKNINHLHRPSSGTVSINYTTLNQQNITVVRKKIGYVSQHASLFPHLTIGNNIALALEVANLPKALHPTRISTALNHAGLEPKQFQHRYPDTLSGGEAQRANIARAIANQPEILLMDEPFSALDNITRHTLQQQIKQMQKTLRLTIVLVTHDINEALLLADMIGVLDNGHLIQQATPHTLIKEPKHAVVKQLLTPTRGNH